MIEIKFLRQDDREALQMFADAMRDRDVARMAKPHQVHGQLIEPIDRSFRALKLLRNSLNPELQELATAALNKDVNAHSQLRQLGRQVKTFVA